MSTIPPATLPAQEQSSAQSAPNRARSSKKPEWRKLVEQYEKPSLARSLWQIANSVVPYLGMLVLMYFSLGVSYWLTLGLSVLAAGFLVRTFIICHDCGHNSFFKNRRANKIVGFFTGLMTFLPAHCWSHEHARHHATSGDLDRRGYGDIWTVTVDEYVAMSKWSRFCYRFYRNPIVMFVVAPLYIFLLHYRVWKPGSNVRVRWSTMRTNLALAIIMVVSALTIGFKAYVMIQLPIIAIAGTLGIWLFYVQHQFEDTYWEKHEEWDYFKAAIDGASFYKLPRILQWFSGNIGFHHVHHLSPRIPNYYLERCHYSTPVFQSVRHITIFSSFRSLGYRLWDENRKKLVGFSYVPVYLKKLAEAKQAMATSGKKLADAKHAMASGGKKLADASGKRLADATGHITAARKSLAPSSPRP